MKKITCCFLGLLLVWYSLNMIGSSVGNFILVERTTEMVEIVYWFVFVVGYLLFIFKEKIGIFVISVLMILWDYVQFSMFFRKSFDGYYRFFANTHRLFKPSSDFLVKDTYHMILDILLILASLSILIYIIMIIKNKLSSRKIAK